MKIKAISLRLAGLLLALTLTVGILPTVLYTEAVDLNSGKYEKWIDRIDISNESYARKFYDWLVKCTDLEAIISGEAPNDLVDPTNGMSANGKRTKIMTGVSSTVKNAFRVTGDHNRDSQNAYTAIKNKVSANESEIVEYLSAAYHAFDRDYPQVFWLSGEFQFESSLEYYYDFYGNVTYKLDVYVVIASGDWDMRSEKYRDPDKIIEAIKTTFLNEDSAVNKILAGCNDSMSDYEKVRYFNKKLTEINSYNSNVYYADSDAYECISALNGRTWTNGPVCEGYANALKVLCDYEGIPCVLVDGEAGFDGDTEAHMWNYVQIEGAWYAVDTTWNDPYVVGSYGAVSGAENEDYFLVGAETMVDGAKFISSHPETNYCYNSYVYFTNGPSLSQHKYGYVAPHIIGDVNRDGKVNAMDKVAITKLIKSGGYTEYADINGDGRVNAMDKVVVTVMIKAS